jgi:two-component system response regulator MprA
MLHPPTHRSALAGETRGPGTRSQPQPLMHLPDARPDNSETSPGTTARGTGGRAIILVVERDPHIRTLESYFLNEAGFAVEFASDGIAALEQAQTLRPDIIISEVLVPRLDGLALCRSIKSDPQLRDVVVLIFSILAVESRAREAGADAFLMKPLAEKRLVDTVRQLLQIRHAAVRTGDIA